MVEYTHLLTAPSKANKSCFSFLCFTLSCQIRGGKNGIHPYTMTTDDQLRLSNKHLYWDRLLLIHNYYDVIIGVNYFEAMHSSTVQLSFVLNNHALPCPDT